MDSVRDNLLRIRERIARSAERVDRDPSAITLVAVTKTIATGRIREAVAEGVRDLGESYYQEARDKLSQFDADVRWHFIGHLQTNKAKYVAGRFVMIHSVDSIELAAELGRRAQPCAGLQPVLVEVKLDPAATKFGVVPQRALDLAAQVSTTSGLRLCGFMGMAPYSDDPEQARGYFKRLRLLFEELPIEYRHTLSMGMTGDFEIAIEEGATMVRIGTGIFGVRG